MNETIHANAFGLAGRVCVVTGSGSGIGRGIAVALAQVGARVALLDRSVEGNQATLDEIIGTGGEATAIACDVSSPASVELAAERSVATLGPCDVLVNNAGMIRPCALESLAFEEWNALLAVNLTGYFLCSQTFGRQMRAKARGRWSILPRSRGAIRPPSAAPTASRRPASRCCRSSWRSSGVRMASAAMRFIQE